MSRSSRRRPSPLYLLLLLVVAGGLYLYEAGHLDWLGLSPSAANVSLPEGTWVQAYFTDPDFDDVDPHRGGLDSYLIDDIERAQSYIDIATFDFDLPSLTAALVDAEGRGVQVRMVIDDENLESEEVLEAVEILDAGGVSIVFDERSAFMHNKFVIIDDQILWTGSWNLTDNGTYRNNNNVLRFELPQLVDNYAYEFEEMFLDGAFGARSPADTPYPTLQLDDGSVIYTFFSPEDEPQAALVQQIARAEEEILFMAYSFTDDEIAEALLQAARRGVRVRGVFESRGASSGYAEYERLRTAGLDVRLDGNPAIMHHKVMIIDDRLTITGSYNFTASAAEENDENLLIIEHPDLAQSYSDEFDRVYNDAQDE